MNKTLVIYATIVLTGTATAFSLQDNRIRSNYESNNSERGDWEKDEACCLPDGTCTEELSSFECSDLDGDWVEGLCSYYVCAQDCPTVEFFSNTASPLTIDCSDNNNESIWNWQTSWNQNRIDFNGDGSTERLSGYGATAEYDPEMGDEYSTTLKLIKMGENTGSIGLYDFLDVHPDTIDYGNLDFQNGYSIGLFDFLDVTGDGLADALIRVQIYGVNGYNLFYLENISSPGTSNCTSDIDGNGFVNVTDMLQIISDWGPCE